MSEANRWTWCNVILGQQTFVSRFVWPAVAVVVFVLLTVWPTVSAAQRGNDRVAALAYACLLQTLAALVIFAQSQFRFTRQRVTRDDWTILSLTGVGPRLFRGLIGPAAVDGLFTFGLILPLVLLYAATLGVDPIIVMRLEASEFAWLIAGFVGLTAFCILSMRGALGYFISRQLRWIIPFFWVVLRPMFWGTFVATLPNSVTASDEWNWIGIRAVVAVIVALAVCVVLSRSFHFLAGKKFGRFVGAVTVQDIDTPKILGIKQSRPSKLLTSSRPCYEREVRAMKWGVLKVSWLGLTLLALIAIFLDVATHSGWINRSRELAIIVPVARWTLVVLMLIFAAAASVTTPTMRFDAESRQQTITSLIMAVSAKSYVFGTMGAVMRNVGLVLLTALVIALASPWLDDQPLSWSTSLLVGGISLLVCAYACLIGATSRVAFTHWLPQLVFLVFALLLPPIMIFVAPSLLFKACDRIDEDPLHFDAGMSRYLKKQMAA